ncbi:MAG: HAD family phosphatase [Pseudomonadota bacterium]
MTAFSGCLFDMDGLLLDTERQGMAVFAALMAARGVPAAEAEAFYLTLVGTSIEHTERSLRARYPQFDPAEIDAEWVRGIAEVAERGMPMRPRVAEVIPALARQGVPMAVVTNSSSARAEEHLEAAGLGACFQAVLGRDRVPAPKPDPAPYLTGAAVLGLPPEACAAFEDSDAGTRAARAAGCATWQIPDLRPAGQAFPELGQRMARDLEQAVREAGFALPGLAVS